MHRQTKLPLGPEIERAPIWVTNDRFLYAAVGGTLGVFQQTVTGAARSLFESKGPEFPTSVSSDGRILFYTTITASATGTDVWVRTGDGASATGRPLLGGNLNQKEAQLSPDQKWVAYVSTEAGPNDVFLTKFKFDSATGVATHGESIRISEGGGIAPRWRRDGKELLYLTPDGARFLFAVPVSPPPPFNVVQNWQAMSGR